MSFEADAVRTCFLLSEVNLLLVFAVRTCSISTCFPSSLGLCVGGGLGSNSIIVIVWVLLAP